MTTRRAQELAVVLHDLAWVLPRTVGAAAAIDEPMPATELEVMRLLTRRPGASVNEVAAQLGLQPSNVSAAVRALLDRGLLVRRPDPRDRRVVRLQPTATARAARTARERSWAGAMDDALADLDAADRSAVLAALPALQHLAAGLAARL